MNVIVVDPATRRTIWKVIQQHKLGRTFVLSTHMLDEADDVLRVVRAVRVADNVYHGLGRNQPYTRNFRQQRLRCADRALYQLPLQFGASSLGEGIQVRGIASRPSQKGNFVYGRDKRLVRTFGTQHPSEGACEGGEGIHPVRAEDV